MNRASALLLVLGLLAQAVARPVCGRGSYLHRPPLFVVGLRRAGSVAGLPGPLPRLGRTQLGASKRKVRKLEAAVVYRSLVVCAWFVLVPTDEPPPPRLSPPLTYLRTHTAARRPERAAAPGGGERGGAESRQGAAQRAHGEDGGGGAGAGRAGGAQGCGAAGDEHGLRQQQHGAAQTQACVRARLACERLLPAAPLSCRLAPLHIHTPTQTG